MNKTPWPSHCDQITRRTVRLAKSFSAVCLSAIALVCVSGSAYGSMNHRPFISSIPDQRSATGGFATKYFTVREYDTGDYVTSVQVEVVFWSDQNFYSNVNNITWGSCSGDPACPSPGGYSITFTATGNLPDAVSAIKVTAFDNNGASVATSFTLQKGCVSCNPPTLGDIPDEVIQLGTGNNGGAKYAPVWFVATDLNANGQPDSINGTGGSNLEFSTWTSDTTILPSANVEIFQTQSDGRSYTLAANTLVKSGRVVVMVTASDAQTGGNTSSTSFVLDVISAGNVPPSIAVFGDHPEWVEDDGAEPTWTYGFFIHDPNPGLDTSLLLVTATSSNTNLVPNDPSHLSVVWGDHGGAICYITPLPLPPIVPNSSSTVPQATTITLAVSDQVYTRRFQFLYVRRDLDSELPLFPRPCGIYDLVSDQNEEHHPDHDFLTGEMRRVSWADLEPNGPNDSEYGTVLNPIIQNLPQDKFLSLNLMGVPNWVDSMATERWCSGSAAGQEWDCEVDPLCLDGTFKAAPWDGNLQTARNNFLHRLAEWPYAGPGTHFRDYPYLKIFNPNLPGCDAGFHDGEVHLHNMCGYSRTKLWNAAKSLLDKAIIEFPNTHVQFGFFTIEDDDDCDVGCDQEPLLWRWLYPKVRDRYNGDFKQRISFFKEDLAANRWSAAPDFIPYNPASPTAYNLFPMEGFRPPSFLYDPNAILRYNNGIVYQANTAWTAPFKDDKVDKILNSTPNDGLEGAFNSWFNLYLELYSADTDHAQPLDPQNDPQPWDIARWKAGLDSWSSYLDYLCNALELAAPAGLMVERKGANSNTVSWFASYGASSYKLQARSLSPLGDWTDVKGCDATLTACTDTASVGSQYAYRVQASDENGEKTSTWANIGVFLSESSYDGYVSNEDGNYKKFADDAEPGIQAGQSADTDLAGVVSFDTSVLGEKTTIIGAQLRLKQYTDNKGFDALGACVVDIDKGVFNDNVELEPGDFNAIASATNVISEDEPLIGVDAENWTVAEMARSNIAYINNTGRTQFRLYFNYLDKVSDATVGWYSAASVDNEPQLHVRYIEPE